MRENRWTLASPPQPEVVARLSKEINVPEPIAKVLVLRGIDDYDKAKAYFRPSLSLLHDPFMMKGMESAANRLVAALQNNEHIRVFGDYDVDGTNGAAMLYVFFKELGGQASYYIPDRLKEGYGISNTGIDNAVEAGATVFLAVDCGITAVDQVGYANRCGLDVIICDHHEPGSAIPNAYAVLDPIQAGDTYPFKSLCGCGVGFKLIQAVAKKLGKESVLPSYLDFVTLASTADIVSLTGENRILVRLGLESINKNPRPGIRALIEIAGFTLGNVHTGQIVFGLAPRINAVGRLGDAMRAVRLLTSETVEEAERLAKVMEEENMNRRKIDGDTFEEAQLLIERECDDVEAEAALVLHQDHWHPGVVGIVASRMVEKYYKPSIMMATVDGVAKGSARSVSGFNIYDALKRCEESILQFGGHKYAAGVTVELAKLEEFKEAFKNAVRDLMSDELRKPEIKIDTEITLQEITPRLVRLLNEFSPFGPGNMRPVFLSQHLELAGPPRIVGRNHLRFKVKQNNHIIDAIGFNLGHLMPKLTPGRRDVECVFTIEENDFVSRNGNGRRDTVPQLKIKDIK
ncbi:MAG: single-stranded-DNA-specific exonuclease RecJ [Bacteroidetes bacterium]|nr:single-stranded-DNA-specific exonuclease RecJ [Bacteroidota bacterium]MCW5895056.1 single-stranded-DNA-specific exonuclease RecJ [Bacteroidota bacterium]